MLLIQDEMKALNKQMKREGWEQWRQAQHRLAAELRAAWGQRRLVVVDKVCRGGQASWTQKRRYDMPVGYRPTMEEAEALLQLPATQGGMEAGGAQDVSGAVGAAPSGDAAADCDGQGGQTVGRWFVNFFVLRSDEPRRLGRRPCRCG